MNRKPSVLFIWNKDIRHPDAGGGTIEFFAIMKSLVAKGFRVTQVSGNFSGSKAYETIEGVNIIRMGKLYTMPFFLWKAQMTSHFLDKFDVIVEGLGYVSLLLPVITSKPVMVVCQHLPKEIFSIEGPRALGKPLGYVLPPIARIVESAIMPTVYKRAPVFTFSESTKKELVETGIPEENVFVFPNALAGMTMRNDPLVSGGFRPSAAIAKRTTPTIICVGRLRKYKGVQDLIRAMPRVKQEFLGVTLFIVGKGEYEPQLKQLSHALDLDQNIVFSGYVDVSEKFSLISSSNLLVMPSYREGFATPVFEAQMCGTVPIVSDAVGVGNLVEHGKTGLIFHRGDSEELAKCIIGSLRDSALIENIRLNLMKLSRTIDWSKNGQVFLDKFEEKLTQAYS